MNIVILSGGSGNDSLITGLKSFYPQCDIKVIINAYDDGKSTGTCRKITNTLGVSDIRKNHIRMYKALTKYPDKRLIEFYEGRYTIKTIEEIFEKLDRWGLEILAPYIELFAQRPLVEDTLFENFNIANIVYSEMNATNGYEWTNNFFCNLLGINDFVILNSFENVTLQARTLTGNILKDENSIVNYKNGSDPILSIQYENNNGYKLNEKAIKAIEEADLIIISTGTFWSSIYPTLHYGDFYIHINKSGARKIWAINNSEDHDSYNVTVDGFITHIETLGLDLSQFKILINTDADESLKNAHLYTQNCVYYSMQNIDGKHTGLDYAKAILREYYDIKQEYDLYLFDFDDTLWARDKSKEEVSIQNILLLYRHFKDNSIIISGNSFKSIISRLYRVFGTDGNIHQRICAEANAVEYDFDRFINVESTFTFDTEAVIKQIQKKFDVKTTTSKNNTYVKIKPLKDSERELLVSLLNNIWFKNCEINDCVAISTGKTTVDIVSKNNSKGRWFQRNVGTTGTTLYIGDEVDKGNDSDIACLCTTSIHTSGVEETNTLLRLLIS